MRAEDLKVKAVRRLGTMAGLMERAIELDPSLGKGATLKEVLDSGALGREGPDAPESLSAKRRKRRGE